MLGNDIFITVSIVTIFRNSDSVVLVFFPFHQPYYGVTWGTRIYEWHRPEFQPGFLLLSAEWLSVSGPVFWSLNFCFYYMGIALPTSPVMMLRWYKDLKSLSTVSGSWGVQLVVLAVLPPVMQKEIWKGQLKVHNSDSFSTLLASCRCSLHLQLLIYLYIYLVSLQHDISCMCTILHFGFHMYCMFSSPEVEFPFATILLTPCTHFAFSPPRFPAGNHYSILYICVLVFVWFGLID